MAPRILKTKNSSESETCRRLDRRVLWHPYSRHSAIQKDDFPIITRGKGPYLFDCEGRRYFDAISSWWCCNLGHGHPRLVKAIRAQAKRLQHSMLGNMSHPQAIVLAERLAGLFKNKNRRVFFSSDGASAVEAAIKIAVQYWHNLGVSKRCRLVSFENAYHGDTLGAVSVGYLPHFHRSFQSLLFPVYRASAPFCGHCAWERTPDACACECFKPMRRIIEKHHAEIAAVIIEPLCQCAAGMRMYSVAYLKALAQLCHTHDILLIVDEIAIGFGRTGSMFAFEQAGIDPDIVCLGKGLSGGYLPISAAVIKERVYSAFRDSPSDNTFYHGHTFAGNPIACAAANELLKIYEEENIVAQARCKGEIMNREMAHLRSLKGVRDLRCLGMIAAVELDSQDGKDRRIQAIKKSLAQNGVLIRPLGNVIYLMPPLITPDNLLVKTIRLLSEAVESRR